MDINEFIRRLEALDLYDPELDYGGCPCCEPSASVVMEIDKYGMWVKQNDIADLIKEYKDGNSS